MVNKTARTIDGMRVRGAGASARAVGFDGVSKPRRTTPSAARSSASTGRSVTVRRQTATRKQSSTQVADTIGLSQSAELKKRARLKANQDFLKPVSTLEFDLSSKELKPDYSLKKRDLSEDDLRNGKKLHGKKLGNKKVGKNKHKKLKRSLAIVGVLILLAGGAFAIWGNALIAKLTGGKAGLFELIGAMTSHVDLKTDKNGRTNILLFGTSGFDMEGTGFGGEEHDGSQLTDSIMLLSVDQKSGDVAMSSLPRDLYVGNTCTSTGKINEVYYCANMDGTDEEAGAEALQSTVEEIFGVDIQYWAHMNWGALQKVVDSVGGVTVTLDEDIEDAWTNTYIKAGEATDLDGWQAVALARARHGTEMGDFSRGASQQKILAGLQNRLLTGGLDLGSVLGILDAVGDNLRSSFDLDEMKAVFYIAKDISMDQIRQIPLIDYENNIVYLTTADMGGASYVVPSAGVKDYSEIQDYVGRMISSDPVIRENAQILVLNGSGTEGAATSEKAKLVTDKFSNVETGNAPTGEYEQKYYLYDITGEKPGTVEAMKSRYNVEALPADALPATINPGSADIVIILGKSSKTAAAQ